MCDDTRTSGAEILDISVFEKLKILRWRSPRANTDVRELRKCLRQLKNLAELNVDKLGISTAGSWHYQWVGRERDTLAYMSSYLPELDFRSLDTTVPTLTKLTLGGVPVGMTCGTEKLEFHSLSSLKLRDCPGTAQLLDAIAVSTATISLQVLEIFQTDLPIINFDPQSPSLYLKDFLLSFTGLERVYLALCAGNHWDSIIPGILNHKASLKHLVVHNRVSQTEVESGNWRISDDWKIFPDANIVPLVKKLELESLGIGNNMKSLVRSLYWVWCYSNSYF